MSDSRSLSANSVSASGSSRLHFGDNINNHHYYGSDPHSTSTTPQPNESELTKKSSGENGIKLWRAAKAGTLPRVNYLLKIGADLSYQNEEDATTPLHQAVLGGHIEILTALLGAGANIDAGDNKGLTPLHQAVLGGHIEILTTLLKAGAKIDAQDNKGATALHLASSYNVVEMLIAAGADIDHEDFEALNMISCSSGDLTWSRRQASHKNQTREQYTSRHLQHHLRQKSSATPQQGTRCHASPNSKTSSKSALEAECSSDLNENSCDQDPRLIIGIHIDRIGRVKAAYSFIKAQVSESYDGDIEELIDHHDALSQCLGFPPVQHVLNVLNSGKTVGDLLLQHLDILHKSVLQMIMHLHPENSKGTTRNQVVLVVPDDRIDELWAAAIQAVKNAALRGACLITTSEAALLHALYNEAGRVINVGDIFVVCKLSKFTTSDLCSCSTQEIASISPFKLKELGKAPFYNTPTEYLPEFAKPGFSIWTMFESTATRSARAKEQWHTNIAKYVSGQIRRHSIDSQNRRHKAVVLIGATSAFGPGLRDGIRKDLPDIEIIHRAFEDEFDEAHDPDGWRSARRAVMYGLFADRQRRLDTAG